MAGEVQEGDALQAESLPNDSISFGRFEVESLSWERRSLFSHNRYLEEVEKYSTPGSVTKKKEYFEAHFKRKPFLHHVSAESPKETKIGNDENNTGDMCSIMEDFIGHGSHELIEDSCGYGDAPTVSDEYDAVELQKEEMLSAELHTGSSSFNSEKYSELFNKSLTLDGTVQNHVGGNAAPFVEGSLYGISEDKIIKYNTDNKKLPEHVDASSKISMTNKKKESGLRKSQNVSMKIRETAEQKIGKSLSQTHLSTQQMSKKPSKSSKIVSNRRHKEVDSKSTSAKLEKPVVSKELSSTTAENRDFKITTSRNIKAKASSDVKSEEAVSAKQAEVTHRPTHQTVNRVKLVYKAEDKQTSVVFNFKSSERAEKRKEYNLKLEEKLHAKEAELNEIQARTEEVKEAEMKQFRKSLNFKASPMPSFYRESASKVSDAKKASVLQAKSPTIRRGKFSPPLTHPSHENSLASRASNQETPLLCEPQHSATQPASPSVSSAPSNDHPAEANGSKRTTNCLVKKPDGSRGEERGNGVGLGKRGGGNSKSKMRNVKDIVGGGAAAVHVAS